MATKNETRDAVIIWLFSEFLFHLFIFFACWRIKFLEVVYVTIENPAFCLALYLARIHFRGELHHVGHVGWQKSSVDQSELEK